MKGQAKRRIGTPRTWVDRLRVSYVRWLRRNDKKNNEYARKLDRLDEERDEPKPWVKPR